MQLSIAAGVAGTVAVTGTVVASAAPTTKQVVRDKIQPVAAQQTLADSTDLANTQAALAQQDAVAAAQQERAERIAKAKARAVAKRKAAKQAAEKRAAEKQAAEKRAAGNRSFASASASRGVERMSASASNVMQLAAAAASGASYSYGGTGPGSFDCSGYTSYVFAQMGISLPRTSSAQRAATVQVSNPQPGDLVFVYNGGGGSIGHVGIYAGGGYWWEASNPSAGVGKHRTWSSAVSYGRVL
jgi:cell wall-associated NlpC family hydrolase